MGTLFNRSPTEPNMKVFLAVLSLAALGQAFPQNDEEVDLRAAAPAFAAAAAANGGDNCYCQCSSFTYRNSYGKLHGNCKSSWNGAQWCYIDERYNDCQDIANSSKFGGKRWSYEACATPALNSYQCRNININYDNPNAFN